MRPATLALVIAVVLAGCGGTGRDRTSQLEAANPKAGSAPRLAASGKSAAEAKSSAATRAPSPRPRALVTAETEDRLVVVDLASGRIERRLAPPADPEFVATARGAAVVVSPRAGAVTVLDASSLRPIRVLRGFGSPHIAEISPDGRYAYVTDDARGELAVIRLSDGRLLGRIPVGAQAHHLTVRPDGRQVWLALGESARTIVIVDASDPARPRVIGHFDPGFPVHDLLFSPDGRRVWISSADSSEVGVFSARTRHLLFRVPGGAPPQHVVFEGRRAYVSSGYGSQIEMVDPASGRVLEVAHAPYGSFNLDASGGIVAAASLLRGTLAIYDDELRPLRVVQIAPAARDVAILP